MYKGTAVCIADSISFFLKMGGREGGSSKLSEPPLDPHWIPYEPVHEISTNEVCATSKGSTSLRIRTV